MSLAYTGNSSSNRTQPKNQRKTVPQIMFLGASVANFTTNLGWGAQASSLNVNLVTDNSGCTVTDDVIKIEGQAGGGFDNDNHYYDTPDGDNLYVSRDPSTGRGILYGKIHHKWSTSKGKFVSVYHRKKDPGFFGLKNNWVTTNNAGYDITGTPVYFRCGDFEYSGLIKNWETSAGSGGETTTVTIESPASLLANSYIIVGEYAGSVFARSTSAATIGAPRNYYGDKANYDGKIEYGAIHNLFNVYGFLESFEFGFSDQNEQGIPISYIINAMQILTSEKNKAISKAFTPFQRIIGRAAMQSDQSFCPTGFYDGHGLFPYVSDGAGGYRHEYILDLSELPRPNNLLRMNGPVISILDLVTQVCDMTSRDFFIELIPMPSENGNLCIPVIKVRTVNRYTQPAPNQVKNIINSIMNTYAISNISYGQESGEALNRTMLIGGPQQRLYQAKNFRLAYTQCNYILDPSAVKAVNFYSYNMSKYRVPSGLSTRLATNANLVASDYSWLIADDEIIKNKVEDCYTYTTSTVFQDTDNGPGLSSIVVGAGGKKLGNYQKDSSYNPIPLYTFAPSIAGSPVDNIRARWMPLDNDVISPFFGFEFEEKSATTDGLPEESLKRPRKVYLDTFTGQQVIVFDIAELPPLRYGINTIYPNSKFVVTETEIRAAMAGFDNLVLYYASKTYKPDLILMLQKTYVTNRMSIVSTPDGPMAMGPWGMVEDQNAADTEGGPSPDVFADQDEEVNVTNLLLSKSFTEDLMAIHAFIADIGAKYYGKAYSVKLPGVNGYRDWTSGGNQEIGTDSNGNPVYVWAGVPKTYYNYEVAQDGAWEEPGNYIDDDIIVGSTDSYHLMDETGRIQTTLGYNASDNFDHTAQKMCSSAALLDAAYRSRKLNPVFGVELYSMQAIEFQDCDNAKFYYPSIDLSGVAEDVLVVNNRNEIKNPYGVGANIPTQHGRKAYVKATTRPNFYFSNANTLSDPRVIVDSPGLFLNSSSLEYTQDPNKTVVSNAALEDLLIYIYTTPSNFRVLDIMRVWSSRLSHMYNGYLLRSKHKKSESAQMVELAPKAAQPFFAAIPLKHNRFVYGPWTDYPHIYKANIFPGSSNQDNMIKNLLSGIRVEVDPEMVPWNYGGSSLMDKAAMLKLYEGQTYQNVIESGSFEIPGLPVFGLGGRLASPYATKNYSNQYFLRKTDSFTYKNSTYNFNYLQDQNFNDVNPVISNIQVTVSESKISTSYSLKVYSKPLSRFNKEAADRLKKIAKQNLMITQRSSTAVKKIVAENIRTLQGQIGRRESGFTGYSTEGASKKLLGWSPVRLLIGSAEYHVSPPTKIAARTTRTNINNDQQSRATGTGTSSQNNTNVTAKVYEGSRGDWDINGSFNSSNSNVPYDQASGPINTMIKDVRHYATVSIHQPKERGLDELNNYGNKAVMSLDGILSPISFYPTTYNSCYSLAKWPRSKCPVCCGSKILNEKFRDYKSNSEIDIKKFCPYCYDETTTQAQKTLPKKSNSNLPLPPYITVKNTGDTNILGISADQYGLNKVSGATINVFSLQPVLQSNGDFKNPNAQPSDKKRHSISVVGRGGVHHGETIGGMTDLIIKNNLENNRYGANPDFNGEVDLKLQQYLSACSNTQAVNIAGNCGFQSYPLNNRFMGLRGPLMLHAWGYDLDGYPVPNAAEEPKEVNDKGMFKRHKKKQATHADGSLVVDADNNPVYEDDYDHAGDFPGGSLSADQLGSIIGKSQVWSATDNKWSKPVRSDKFYLNWGERPDLWPVGPIDLRWDKERKVWVAPQPKVYKNVYITLEEDLVTVQNPEDTLKPCRGFITDLEYDTTSEDVRKLVFVVDKSGYTAPKGAKLLCMYNPDSGFYEILSKPTFTAFGTIESNGSNATLTLTYMQSRNRSIDTNTVSVPFSNPFSFGVSAEQKGLFMYIDGAWNLISTN